MSNQNEIKSVLTKQIIEFCQRMEYKVQQFPWRCNDTDVSELVDTLRSLALEYNELYCKHNKLQDDSIKHGEVMLGHVLDLALNQCDSTKR